MTTSLISIVKKVLSYIYPITQKVFSIHNGVLEITYINGKKTLNTQHANYSFGSLHRVMQFALYKIAVKENQDILLLGLGGGSAIKIMREDLLLNNHIDVVDIDPKIIELAKKEFGLGNYVNIEIHCQNASVFVQEVTKKYGLIIIDLFIDSNTPKDIYEDVFWIQVIRLAKKKSCVIFNTLSINNSTEKITHIDQMLKKASFEVFIYPKVEVFNTLLIAQRK